MTPDSSVGTFYTIRIREKLDATWAEWFDPMKIRADGEQTILYGCLPDQSALHGMLNRLHSLGLQLVAVSQEQCS